jgi:hypothetical protein
MSSNLWKLSYESFFSLFQPMYFFSLLHPNAQSFWIAGFPTHMNIRKTEVYRPLQSSIIVNDLEPSTQRGINSECPWCHLERVDRVLEGFFIEV